VRLSHNQGKFNLQLGKTVYWCTDSYFWSRFLFTTLILLSALAVFLWFRTPVDLVEIRLNQGQVLYQSTQNEPFKPLDPSIKHLPADGAFRVEQSNQGALHKSLLTLRYEKKITFLLTPGSLVQRQPTQGFSRNFQIQGSVHLALRDLQDAPANQITLNGLSFHAKQAQIFFAKSDSETVLQVTEGQVTLPAQSALSGKITLSAPQTLVLRKGQNKIIVESQRNNLSYWKTFIPAFETLKEYRPIGVARIEGASLELKRQGQAFKITHTHIEVLNQDKFTNRSKKNVTFNLKTKDRLRLYPGGTLKLELSPPIAAPASTNPPGINQSKQPVLHGHRDILFSYGGKLRVLANKKFKGRKLQFRSVQSNIGVKGTDFETTSSPGESEVLVVEGKVGFSDTATHTEVDVPAGKLSSVGQGQGPTPPTDIPPQRLAALLKDSLDPNVKCGFGTIQFDETDPAKIAEFQRLNQIKVDGLMGSQTKRQVVEIQACRDRMLN